MATERNRGEGGQQPDPSKANREQEFNKEKLFLAAQFRGYKGPMAREVFEWRQRGLGVEVDTQIALPPGQDGADKNDKQNQLFFYAMRLPKNLNQGNERTRLAIFLTEHHYSLVTIKPKASRGLDQKARESDNWATNVDFDAIFKPQDDPDSPPAIVSAVPMYDQLTAFQLSIDMFPFEAKEVALMPDYYIQQAVAYEEKLKQQRDLAAQEQVLATQLQDIFDPQDLADLDAKKPKADTLPELPHYDVNALEQMVEFGDELSDVLGQMEKRLPGPMGDQLEELDKHGGAVRIISALQPNFYRKGGPEYRVMCVAIELDLKDDNPRHALVFPKVPDDPNNLEDSFDVRIVHPKKAEPGADGRAQATIESAREDYSMMLTPLERPSPAPYDANEWICDPFQSPLESFDRNLHNLPFVLDTSDKRTPDEVRKAVVEKVQMLQMLHEFSDNDLWSNFDQLLGEETPKDNVPNGQEDPNVIATNLDQEIESESRPESTDVGNEKSESIVIFGTPGDTAEAQTQQDVSSVKFVIDGEEPIPLDDLDQDGPDTLEGGPELSL